MLEFRTLGTIDLLSRDGGRLHALLSAPKRLGLLSYLALSRPLRFHPRDELLALFWPELDGEHARATLRQTVRLLRLALGREVLESRGGDLGVVGERLWCDATAFEAALDAGELAEAVDLYRGPLLPGLHFATCSGELEDWREGETARLRERAARALWTLAEEAEGVDPVGAERLWRRLLTVTPFDEEALRCLVRHLVGRGNRARAVTAYDEFAHRLETQLDLAPSPETLALVGELRRGSTPAVVE